MQKIIKIGSYLISNTRPLAFMAGTCVIESETHYLRAAKKLKEIIARTKHPFILKASFDKANRTSVSSFRGPGLEKGLQMLSDVKSRYGLRILTDIHESWQAPLAGEVADVLQIPAFLCRQTDLLVSAAHTGRVVNIKKAQFLSGEDMRYPVEKALDAGASEVWLTERGNSFGYNNLVVDFRNIVSMLDIVPRVIMDCTHSVQRPGGAGGKTGGDRRYVPMMAQAAKAFGATGYFFEVHPESEAFALCSTPVSEFNQRRIVGINRSVPVSTICRPVIQAFPFGNVPACSYVDDIRIQFKARLYIVFDFRLPIGHGAAFNELCLGPRFADCPDEIYVRLDRFIKGALHESCDNPRGCGRFAWKKNPGRVTSSESH